MRMQSTGFSCPSRSISVCSGSARWLWPAAVMTAFLMRKEAPGGKCETCPEDNCSPARTLLPWPLNTTPAAGTPRQRRHQHGLPLPPVFPGVGQPASIVGRSPWTAADAPVGLFAPCQMLKSLFHLRDEGIPRRPGAAPQLRPVSRSGAPSPDPPALPAARARTPLPSPPAPPPVCHRIVRMNRLDLVREHWGDAQRQPDPHRNADQRQPRGLFHNHPHHVPGRRARACQELLQNRNVAETPVTPKSTWHRSLISSYDGRANKVWAILSGIGGSGGTHDESREAWPANTHLGFTGLLGWACGPRNSMKNGCHPKTTVYGKGN